MPQRPTRSAPLRLTAGLLALLALPATPRPAAAQAQPPHAWLFGTWTGGLFPAPSNLSAEACLSQPVVIFTRDVVLRATLTDQLYTQRLISTARVTPSGFDFAFTSGVGQSSAAGLFGMTAPPPPAGFGCESPDVLHIVRRGENEITFPGCADFPNPLVRCPSR